MNGMHTNSRQMLIEYHGLDSQDSRSKREYVLKLGRIVSVDPQEIDRTIVLNPVLNPQDL